MEQDRKRRGLLCLLSAAVLILSAAACGEVSDTDSGFYSHEVLSALTEPELETELLPGMAEELCVIMDEGLYDPELIEAGAAGLFCETRKEVLYAKNASDRMYPASLTKLMTALLVLESPLSLSDEICAGPELSAFNDSSSLAGLREGESYSVEELLTALLVPSGNDAANVLAKAVSGSVEAFTEAMNEKALALGMVNTCFVSPHGLHDPDHYTTVYDLYLLTRECIQYTDFLRIASLAEADISGSAPDGTNRVLSFRSTNSYLRGYTEPPEGLRVRASKTGYTASAGRCLILCVSDEGGELYISIILNAATYDGLYSEMNGMLSIIGQ